jgi:hypothetical protein
VKSSLSQIAVQIFFPDKSGNIRIHRKVKRLMRIFQGSSWIFSEIVQPSSSSWLHSQKADATRPSSHLEWGVGHVLEGEYPNGYEFS